MEIKRIEIKSGPLQIGDTLTMHDGSSAIANVRTVALWETADKWVCGDRSKVERDLRPLAEGEVIREGDVCVSLYDGSWNRADAGVSRLQGYNHVQYYRPVRMQSPGWRYLDVGERRPKGYQYFSTRWEWCAGCEMETAVDDESHSNRLRAHWPPREEDKEAVEEAIEERKRRNEEGDLDPPDLPDDAPEPPLLRSCVYCIEPDDETMGLLDQPTGIVTWSARTNVKGPEVKHTRAHARCAQKASRLQPPPTPAPLECQEQWGEEFERWGR